LIPPRRSTVCLSGLFLLCLLSGATGCGARPSADQSLRKAIAQTGAATVETIFPFAGTVTVDGQRPAPELTLVVMLSDLSKPDLPVDVRPSAECDKDGKFSFTTYKAGDGVAGGKTYVVAFALLRQPKSALLGPDQLENRYNDPDQNAKIPEFVIEHKAPGKTNYEFSLKVSDMPPGSLGPHSLTRN
jgi:hypothetical protein